MEEIAPPALVLGCNTPHGIGVLSDWIEEQTGIAPDFHSTSWSDGDWLVICHDSNGNVVSGYGDGFGYGVDYGAGYGDGYNYGDNEGDGSGNRTWFTVHDGNGYGVGYGNANGDGCGNGFD